MPTPLFSCQRSIRRGSCLRNRDREGVVAKTLFQYPANSGTGGAILRTMHHSCQFLCSELVTVTYEEQPGEIRQATANLEEISTASAVVLLEEKPSLGSSISLSIKDRDLFGVIKACLHDATLGWFVIVALDAASQWNRDWFAPKHLLDICGCSPERATQTRALTLEKTKNTEENLPVSFVVSEA